MNHERAQELLGDFALELLDETDQRAVAAHVAECQVCREDLQPLLHSSEALALGQDEGELSRAAAARIAAGARRRATGSDDARPGTPPNLVVGPWRRIALGAAAAVLVLSIGLTGVSIAWLDARDDADRLEGELAARALELPLSGAGASGTIFVSADFQGGVAAFNGLGPAPAQHHYQVWSEGPAGARSAADFSGSSEPLVLRLPELPRDMTRMFVTLEPDGASAERPTGPEVLSTP